MTKRVRAYDRTTLVLSYTTSDANALRAIVQRMKLKGDKRPSLSVIARRALWVYLERLPAVWHDEMAALDQMTTKHPKPAPVSKMQRSAALGALIGLAPGCDAGRSE